MKPLFKTLLASIVLAVASCAAAQHGVPVSQPSPGYDPSTVTPVFVEPYPTATWGNGTPTEAIMVDTAGFIGATAPYAELSPAQQDLGNLIPPGSRPGFFQKANFGAAWMPRFEADGLGMTELNTNLVTALPFPGRHQPLTITPEYTVRFLDGPDFVDVPSRLHDAELNFNHIRRLNDRWVFNGALTLGSYADDHSFDADDAFRVSGSAVGIFEVTPATRWIVGVAYLNRAGFAVVPAVGWLHWTDDLRIDLILPRPKIAWRTWSNGAPGYDERWFYVRGEFGGGIWAVQRTSGADDTLSYSDMRLIVGTERKRIGGISRSWEFGYVFGRELEYDSVGSDIEIDDTLFLRATFAY